MPRAAKQEAPASPPSEAAAPPSEPPFEKREKARKRAIGMVAKAADKAATDEEARTNALFGARIIHEHKLLEHPPPRHPLVDRLADLGDDTLDSLAPYVEQFLDGGEALDMHFARLEAHDVARWRAEARLWQRRLTDHLAAMQWVLENGQIAIADARSTYCVLCRRRLLPGEIVARRRRRVEAHMACHVVKFARQL